MLGKKKLPNFDTMSKEQLTSYVVKEIATDLTRGDRYALTRICEMWTKEEIMTDLMDHQKMETVDWSPKLKPTSMKFILDLWDRWDRQNDSKNHHKSTNQRHDGRTQKDARPISRKNNQNNRNNRELVHS